MPHKEVLMGKSVFYRVGNHIVNQYEVRSVEVLKPTAGKLPKVLVTYKNGDSTVIVSKGVPKFIAWINGQVVGCPSPCEVEEYY
jgi:hypothetical protein